MQAKKLIISVGSIVVVLVVLITVYYYYSFYGAIKNIEKTLYQSQIEYKDMNKPLKELIVFVEGVPQVKNWLAKVITIKYASKNTIQRHKQLKHHIRSAVWRILLDIKFNDDELIYLWCSHAPYFEGNGLINASIYEFGRDLNQLSTREIITLIVNTRAPLSYQRDPSKLKLKVNTILARWRLKHKAL